MHYQNIVFFPVSITQVYLSQILRLTQIVGESGAVSGESDLFLSAVSAYVTSCVSILELMQKTEEENVYKQSGNLRCQHLKAEDVDRKRKKREQYNLLSLV